MSTVHWRGSRFDARTHAMLKEAERIGGVRIEPTQGSYNTSVSASAGTHSGGGAVDIRTKHLHPADRNRLLVALRAVGFAAWHRTQQQGFSMEHIHAIAVGCPDLAPAAADQVRQYLAGRDGLKQRGPDTGPRDFPGGPGTTWESYNNSPASAPVEPQEDEVVVIFIQHKGKRYASYPAAGIRRHIGSPAQERNIRAITERAGGRVIEWSAGKDVDDPDAFGRLD